MLKAEKIEKGGKILAIVIRTSVTKNSLEFVTPPEFPLQLGFHNRPKGDYIKAHRHVPFKNQNMPSQEIFHVVKGKISVSIYDGKKKYKEVIVSKGEIILLNSGHNVKFLEDTKMMEVKQGPYRKRENEKIMLE